MKTLLVVVISLLVPAALVGATPPFPNGITGFAPPSLPIDRCESGAATQMAKLLERLATCRERLVVGEFTNSCGFTACLGDFATCELQATTRFDDAVAPCPDAPCLQPAHVALVAGLIAPYVGSAIYCAGTTPLGDGPNCFVPDTIEHAVCEVNVARRAAKLVTKLVACHRRWADAFAHGRFPSSDGEAKCEQRAREAFVTGVGKVPGCPSCFAAEPLAMLVASLVDGNNDAVYCAFPSPAFLDDRS